MEFDGKKHVNIMLEIEAARREARRPITDYKAYYAHVHTALVLSTMFVDVLNPTHKQTEAAVLCVLNKIKEIEENDNF